MEMPKEERMGASCKGNVVKRKDESFPGNKKASTHCRPQMQFNRNITFFILKSASFLF